MNESYDDPLARIQAAKQVAQQAMAKQGKQEVCDPPMGIETPAPDQAPPPCAHGPEPECGGGVVTTASLPAWQDVLCDAEQVVRQKPIFAKHIKGTTLENDVPVWMADFALRMLQRERARRPQDFDVARSHDYDDVLQPFLTLMRKELDANSRKGDRPGWLAMDANALLLEVYWHTAKLSAAVKNNDGPAIIEHSADVANMAMMVLDVCGGLTLVDANSGH